MIQHVSLEVGPAAGDATLAFWGLLGFRRVAPPAGLAERAAWLQSGPTQIHLLWIDAPVVVPKGHVALVVEDYDATVASLRAAGHEVEPRVEHWGSPRAYVHDPAGNLVELMAFAPPIADAPTGP